MKLNDRPLIRLALVLAALLFCVGAAAATERDARGGQGMVASAHPEASKVGMSELVQEILLGAGRVMIKIDCIRLEGSNLFSEAVEERRSFPGVQRAPAVRLHANPGSYRFPCD